MASERAKSFRLDDWTIEPLRGSISAANEGTRHLEPKVMDVLVLLAEHANELVPREQLLDAVWAGHAAADQLLTRAISELRRALRDDRDAPRYIETVPKRGYRLTATVRPFESVQRVDARTARVSPTSTPRRARTAVLLVAVLAVAGYLAVTRYDRSPAPEQSVADTNDPLHRVMAPMDVAASVAVLPFIDISDEAGGEYFADGLAEEIRNLLATVPDLKVIGRTSSFAFKGSSLDLRDIGRQLGVKMLLEGSVRRSGDRLRITARLIDAADGTQIWSNTYRRRMIDVFELQDEVSAAVIDALQLRIGRYPTRGRPTGTAEAYTLYLQARQALNIQDAATAEAALLQAVELDEKFAEAWELLAHVYWTEVPGIDAQTGLERTRDAAAQALAIDPGLDFARALFMGGDIENHTFADVLEAQLLAARNQPNNPMALRTVSWNLLISGYIDEALQVAERYVALDPLSSIAHIRRAAAYRAAGRTSDSVAEMWTADRLSPADLQWYIGEGRLALRLDDEAIPYLEGALTAAGVLEQDWLRELVAAARDPEDGQADLDARIPLIVRSTPGYDAAELQGMLNRFYLLFGYLDRYFEIIFGNDAGDPHWSDVVYYVWSGTVFRELGFTAHPRYPALAERMGFVDAWERRGPPDFCEKAAGRWHCR